MIIGGINLIALPLWDLPDMTLAWKVNNLMFDTQMMRLGALQPVRITLWASTNWPSSKARVTSVNSLSRLTRWFSLGTKLRIHKKIKHPNKFWDANNCNRCQYWYDLTTRLKIHMILMTETSPWMLWKCISVQCNVHFSQCYCCWYAQCFYAGFLRDLYYQTSNSCSYDFPQIFAVVSALIQWTRRYNATKFPW